MQLHEQKLHGAWELKFQGTKVPDAKVPPIERSPGAQKYVGMKIPVTHSKTLSLIFFLSFFRIWSNFNKLKTPHLSESS